MARDGTYLSLHFAGISSSVYDLMNPCPEKKGTKFPLVEATIAGVHGVSGRNMPLCWGGVRSAHH